MVQGGLGKIVVIGCLVLHQRGIAVISTRKAGLLGQVADAAVEAFDHAVGPRKGLRMALRAQAMFDAQGHAGHVGQMPARGRPGVEAVSEQAAVVGQNIVDPHGRDALEAAQELPAAAFGLVAVGAHVDRTRGSVDVHERVATMGLVGYLRQVLDVHVQQGWEVILERLQQLDLALDFGLKGLKVKPQTFNYIRPSL